MKLWSGTNRQARRSIVSRRPPDDRDFCCGSFKAKATRAQLVFDAAVWMIPRND
jgi:hypothetical protein